MTGTYGCAQRDAAANFRMQNPYRQIGMSDRAAAKALNGGGSCPTSSRQGVDSDATKDLEEASKTGQGVTKPELQDIVTRAVQRGGGEKLGAPTRRALGNAVKSGQFARQSTAQLALQLSQGKVSPADIGAQIGRSS